jgi:outer membrane immunogenic protein
MKRSFCVIAAAASLIAALIGSSAMAADLCCAKAPPPPCCALSWTGWYVGFNAGWVGSTGNTINITGTDTDGGGLGSALAAGNIPAAIDLGYSGFLGGGQFGYNWQSGIFVYGLEADLDAASAKSGVTLPDARFIPPAGIQSPFTINAARQLDWLGTLRGRVGVTASAPLLLYVTGGLAFGEHELGIGVNDPGGIPPAMLFNQTSTWSAGWTLGAGGEWMFDRRWSLKAEYLYVDLGNVSSTINYAYTTLTGAQTSSLTATVHDRDNIVRGGVNYHF